MTDYKFFAELETYYFTYIFNSHESSCAEVLAQKFSNYADVRQLSPKMKEAAAYIINHQLDLFVKWAQLMPYTMEAKGMALKALYQHKDILEKVMNPATASVMRCSFCKICYNANDVRKCGKRCSVTHLQLIQGYAPPRCQKCAHSLRRKREILSDLCAKCLFNKITRGY